MSETIHLRCAERGIPRLLEQSSARDYSGSRRVIWAKAPHHLIHGWAGVGEVSAARRTSECRCAVHNQHRTSYHTDKHHEFSWNVGSATNAELALMVAEGSDLVVAAWWVLLFPALAIILVVLSMNPPADWLQDPLDP